MPGLGTQNGIMPSMDESGLGGLSETGDDSQLVAGGNAMAPNDAGGGDGSADDRNWNDEFEEGNDASYGQDPFASNGFSNIPTTAQGSAETPRDGLTATSTMDEWVKPDWPKRGVKPECQNQWESSTMDHLNYAKVLVKQAQQHAKENDKHIHGARERNKSQKMNVHSVLKKKMEQTSDLIRALEDRHESIEDTIRQVGECLFQLQRAHRSKWAPLNVCERRLELRESRPLSELIRDHTQEALEHERQTLIESRQELSDQVQSCKEMLLTLDDMRQQVIEDLSHKRHGQRIDRSCLSPCKHSVVHGDRIVLPQLGEVSNFNTSVGPASKEGEGCVETARQGETKSLIQSVVKLEEDAMRLCNESDAVMLQTKRECARAATQAQTSLAKRADETDGLKRKLEVQMKELDDAIVQTEMSLDRTRKKLQTHEIPLKTLDKQFDQRNKRSDREQGRDKVHDELETQLELVKRNIKVLTDKYQNTKTLLDQLKETRQQLTEDYRNKLLALKIDDACLKVTPRKAIELNRSDPRGGRCRVPAIKSGRSSKKEGTFSLSNSMANDSLGDQGNHISAATF